MGRDSPNTLCAEGLGFESDADLKSKAVLVLRLRIASPQAHSVVWFAQMSLGVGPVSPEVPPPCLRGSGCSQGLGARKAIACLVLTDLRQCAD